MEAPEKIYLYANPITDEPDDRWLPKRSDDNDIEYTRTDAFMKKACELLNRMIWEVTYEDLEGNSTQHYDKTEFIEDFKKNYMKGE